MRKMAQKLRFRTSQADHVPQAGKNMRDEEDAIAQHHDPTIVLHNLQAFILLHHPLDPSQTQHFRQPH